MTKRDRDFAALLVQVQIAEAEGRLTEDDLRRAAKEMGPDFERLILDSLRQAKEATPEELERVINACLDPQ